MCPADKRLSPKILILQSGDDQEWGSALATLLTDILQLGAGQVRCRSIAPAPLPPGSDYYEDLKQEVQSIPVVVAVVSDTTLATPLDMFEVGATWAAGASNPEALFVPVLIRASNPVRVPSVDSLPSRVAPIDGAHLEDLVGQIAGTLGLVPTNLGAQRGRLIQLASPRRRPRDKGKGKLTPTIWFTSAALAGLTVIAIVATLLLRPAPLPERERLGFEEDTNFWNIASSPNVQGFTRAVRSGVRAHLGSHSLRVDTTLSSTDAKRRAAEILFDLRKSLNVNSADLMRKSIAAWVYAPSGAAGEAAKPNGLQLVVKDRNWKSQYGAWSNVSEDRWTKLTLSVGTSTSAAHTDEGFDPSAVIAIGVKLSVGEGAKTDYSGAIYIDSVDW